jgi:SAM-dependent MidA family methyltransferase
MAWRDAMRVALYGADGLYTRSFAADHFRTSALASPLFASALLRVVAAVDDALGRPAVLDVVDIGAGRGDLLRRLAVLAPAHLARRLRLVAIEVAAPPPDLPQAITWRHEPPPPGSLTGLVLATEWLDNVPLDIAEVDPAGRLCYVLVEPATGAEKLGEPVAGPDAAWASRWWAHEPYSPGVRVELGLARDQAWVSAVGLLARGVALSVDYGHMWYARPPLGTLTGFHSGRSVAPVPDGSCDITAHVALDSACAAGEAATALAAVLVTQAEALRALGVDGERPPLELAHSDPGAYVRALSGATQAVELLDPEGLGGHYWLLQPVGLDATALPAPLRP